jgi:hypothetical protein
LAGKRHVARQFDDMPGQGAIAGMSNVRVRVIGFLHQGAQQAGVVRQVVGQDCGTEIHVSQQSFERIGSLAIGRRSEQSGGQG